MNLVQRSALSSQCCCAGKSIHLVQCGCDITHHGHEKEGHLEDSMLQKVQSVNDTFVPGGVVHIDHQR
jgi:hypothetical protein